MLKRMVSISFGLFVGFFLNVNISFGIETQPRTESGEPIPSSFTKFEDSSFVTGRVVCHTFDQLLDLPPNDSPVELSDIEGDKRFVRLLQDIGVFKVRRAFNFDAIEALNNGNQSDDNDWVYLDRSYVFELNKNIDITEAVRILQSRSEVLVAEPDLLIPLQSYDIPPSATKSDFYWDEQENLYDPDEDNDWGIGCPSAWEAIGYGNSDIRVGIIERQIRGSHEDFSSNGINYVEGLAWLGFDAAGEDIWSTSRGDWNNDDTHGNSVAGVVGARSFNEGTGIRGIAGGNGVDEEGVTIVALCFPYGIQVPSTQLGNMIVKASDPESVGGMGCDVINLSSGNSQYNHDNRLAIIHSYEMGRTFVSGKGQNTAQRRYGFQFPGDYDFSMVTCVSGYNTDYGNPCNGDCANYYTDGGKGLDILGPANTFRSLGVSDGYSHFYAVSGANPHVAGSIALLRSSPICQNANFRPEDYEWLLKLTACRSVGDPLKGCGDNTLWDIDYGHGLLRIGYAAEHIAEEGHVFRTYSGFGGVVCDSLFSHPIDYGEYSFLSRSLKGNYKAQVYKVEVPIQYPDDFVGVPLAWGICNQVIGISAVNPNFSKPYCVIENGSQSNSGCTLNTYVMRLHDFNTGQFVGWYPCPPSNVVVKCRVSGVLDTSKTQPGGYNIVSSFSGGLEYKFSSTSQGQAKMSVYDVRGRLLKGPTYFLVNVGENKVLWNGRDKAGRNASTGIYFIAVSFGENTWSQKVTLVR